MTTLPIKIGGVTVLTFDITNQDVVINANSSKKLSALNTQNQAVLCTASNCYNCAEVHCTNVQCNNIQCNQIKCTQVKCSNKQCTGYDSSYLYDSNCGNDMD